ncbi:FG-GAP-like repeat-containing protein [Mangrovimonas sp. YM274]|uniref:FG-GAP-like repeat-containing protein n=1 Tax=Mangrovimonas sp. YM274 TaxID=3070660 RepID=UPI0027DCC350|nr:FG-GAP-like repeat-containing protein [Mangrovimonas sp. YM274]WMI69098.1 FG-GAP-like repeat-containing protein [Mangrovimonas sp. YM274]
MKNKLLICSALITSFVLHAQSYDSCEDASIQPSAVEGTYTVGTINGEVPLNYCISGAEDATAAEWIKYVPEENYTVSISSKLNSNIDLNTRLHIFSGDCNSLTCVSGNDDHGMSINESDLSVVTFDAQSGSTYYIVWDNKWDDSPFEFTLTECTINFSDQFETATGTDYAVVDMNGDFLDDTVSINNQPDNYLININYQLPEGGFNNVSISTEEPNYPPSWSLTAGDFDANGFNDLMYGSSNGVTFMQANDDGTSFNQVSGTEYVFSQRGNFVDINNDGHLDAFMCHDLAPSVSYINDGNNNLIYENTNGLGDYATGGNYGSVWIDYDNDYDMDMFMAKCGGSDARRTNQLYQNNGDGTYTEVGEASGLADVVQTWSSAWGDFDNDGDMDVYVGSYENNNDLLSVNNHKLMMNNGDGTFTDVSVNIADTHANFGRENIPGDFDNDGNLDIYTNGDILFGNGDMTFRLVHDLNVPGAGAIGDLNNDGFLDFFYLNKVYFNNTNNNNWIKIVTIGNIHESEEGSNRNGIGARVEISTPSGIQIRDVRSGEGFKYMHTLNTHFGLGTDTTINYVRVYWPSGAIDEILNPSINGSLVIQESQTLSLEDSIVDNLIIYPNPTKDLLHLSSMSQLDNTVYTVFDLQGKRVLNAKLTSNTIDVSNLANGNYILRLVNNRSIKTQKFIKH